MANPKQPKSLNHGDSIISSLEKLGLMREVMGSVDKKRKGFFKFLTKSSTENEVADSAIDSTNPKNVP